MAAEDKRLSAARREVSLWNMDRRRYGFRGGKGYGFARLFFRRAERRHGKQVCVFAPEPIEEVSTPEPTIYVDGQLVPIRDWSIRGRFTPIT